MTPVKRTRKTPASPPARILGIDYGSKRVGIALSDESQTIAVPLAVIPNDRTLFREVRAFCESRGVTEIVMGDSKDMRGNDNPIMKEVYAFKAELERDLHLPVHLEPEFFTSMQAAKVQGEHVLIDASAAALILQSYLDRQKHAKSGRE